MSEIQTIMGNDQVHFKEWVEELIGEGWVISSTSSSSVYVESRGQTVGTWLATLTKEQAL